ncbi:MULTISPECIES: cobalamin biosynthesis protein CobG [unclassified Novosphingobium]|uniref:cobalamin biosynthesis protein CobG n=1 Tax=unclassified Novosphingobium TaxID=2644732 RepID=UPI0013580D59|nr:MULTISPECIES: cobalamin biosynthesis protein CobG [unclassified Novosphingobium]
MMAGDGLLVRVKPRLGRLTPVQAAGLAEAALACGSGSLDVTRRANLQIRGVSEAAWPDLLDRLVAFGLVDADGVAESRRNILVSPEWKPGDDTHRIAAALHDRLGELPALPGKVGFVIDAGAVPLLSAEPGDFRIERCSKGDLLLRAEGRAKGAPLRPGGEAQALLDLAQWFAVSGGPTAGRMARHAASLPDWANGGAEPARPKPALTPGMHELGAAYGLPFGRLKAQTLGQLAQMPGVRGIRTTPWRILMVEGGVPGEVDGLSIDPHEPLLRIDACPGMPECPQSSVETRELARRLAPHVAGRLHVSGCAKGCAHSGVADVVLTGRGGAYDLSFGQRAGAPPLRAGLDIDSLIAHFGAT